MAMASLNMQCLPIDIKLEQLESSPCKPQPGVMSHHHNHQHHNISVASNELLKCKKRVNLSKIAYSNAHVPPTSVARRNERERNRVKMVNLGFATLRQHVPNGAKNKKMSKVETLRSAVEYIRQLQRLLGQTPDNSLTDEQLENSLQLSSDGDENCYPDHDMTAHMVGSPIDSNSMPMEQLDYGNFQMCYQSSTSSVMYGGVDSGQEESDKMTEYSLTTSTIHNSRTSPSPSVNSDMTTSSSSPYDRHCMEATSRQQTTIIKEEEMFDFSSWF